MGIEDTGTAPATPAGAVAPAVVATEPAKTDTTSTEPAWLPGRLDQARKSMLRELGAEDVADVKTALEELKKRRDAEKTEQELLRSKVAELEKRASKADALEGEIKRQADAALESLKPEHRELISSLAGDDSARILQTIDRMTKSGMLATPAPAAVTPAHPAKLSPATTAPPNAAPTPNQVDPALSHLQEYERRLNTNKDPIGAASYLLKYQREISTEKKSRA